MVTIKDIALISVLTLMLVLKQIVQVWKDTKYTNILPNRWKLKNYFKFVIFFIGKIRDKLIKAVVAVEIQSVDDIKQMADTLAVVAAEPKEVSQEAQVTLMFMKTRKSLDLAKNLIIPPVTLTVIIGLFVLKNLRKQSLKTYWFSYIICLQTEYPGVGLLLAKYGVVFAS